MTNRAIVLMFTAVVLGAACSSGGGSSPTTTPPTTAPQTTSSPTASAGGEVTIQELDFRFDPTEVTASTAQPLVIVNNGQAIHNFSIEGTVIDVDTAPGETTRLEAPGPSFAPGTYTFFCKFHRSQGMEGTLIATSG